MRVGELIELLQGAKAETEVVLTVQQATKALMRIRQVRTVTMRGGDIEDVTIVELIG